MPLIEYCTNKRCVEHSKRTRKVNHGYTLNRLYVREKTDQPYKYTGDNKTRHKQAFKAIGWLCSHCKKLILNENAPTSFSFSQDKRKNKTNSIPSKYTQQQQQEQKPKAVSPPKPKLKTFAKLGVLARLKLKQGKYNVVECPCCNKEGKEVLVETLERGIKLFTIFHDDGTESRYAQYSISIEEFAENVSLRTKNRMLKWGFSDKSNACNKTNRYPEDEYDSSKPLKTAKYD